MYNDPNYGLSTITGLSKWMGASRPGYRKLPNSTPEYAAIVAHFDDIGIALTEEQMDFATSKGSMMMSVSAALEFAILRDPALELHSRDLAMDDVLQSQWGFSGSTSGIGTTLHGVAEIYSVASLSDIFPFAPEFGAYVLDPTRGASTNNYTLSYDSSQIDFAQSTTSYSTFLRQDVMHQFYVGYEAKDTSLMTNLFGFQNWDSVEMFHTYLGEMVNYFLN